MGLAQTWPAEGPPRIWARELGQGHSGFVVAAGKLYTQRQNVGGQWLLCLDPDTGRTIWETRYDWAWQPRGAYPGPYATPTIERGKIYYTSPSGLAGCLDADTGRSLWSLDLRARFQGKGWEFGYAATPLVEAGRVILPVGGPEASLVALDADDGHTIWTSGTEPASYASALPITYSGRRCVVGYLQNAVVVVELATGRRLYHHLLSSNYDEHAAWPLYREPHLLLTSPFRVPALCLTLGTEMGDTLSCQPRWTSRELCNDVVSSVLYREHVYGFDLRQLQTSPHWPSRGLFRCLDWATGRVCWSTERVGHAAVLAADDKLFLLDDTGNLILARAAAAAYEELARCDLFEGETCWTPPSRQRGKLFVRSPSRAVCLHVGPPTQAPTTPRPVPVARPWHLNLSWLLSRERDYPNDAPSWDEMLLWYTTSLLFAFGGAALATGLVRLATRNHLTAIFWASVFCLGLLGPNLLGAFLERFVFTWPATLYAAFHVTLAAYCWAAHEPARKSPWLARLTLLSFLLTALAYFELCKAVGMFIGWSFLFGLLPAFPVSWLAIRARTQLWRGTIWTLLAFTIYFWSCQGLFIT
jgi:hypothetical protein